MGVEEEDAAEDGIEGGVQRTRGEGGDGQGDEAGGEEALEGPVVGAVGGAGLRNGGRVVDCESVSLSCEVGIRLRDHTAALDSLCKTCQYKLENALAIYGKTHEVQEGEWRSVGQSCGKQQHPWAS